MEVRFWTLLVVTFSSLGLYAQLPSSMSFEEVRNTPAMNWLCPEIEDHQTILSSMNNDDIKIYATRVMKEFGLYSDPSSPSDKYLAAQATIQVDNPLFNTHNLLTHISLWVKNKNKGWNKEINIDETRKEISSSASIDVATHASFLTVNKVSMVTSLLIKMIDVNKVSVSLLADRYDNAEYSGSDNRYEGTSTVRISDVFPFVAKSPYKNTYAKAYVGAYQYFWNFISGLKQDLNINFAKDTQMLAQMHYNYSKDSLDAKYGEPTKVIADPSPILDINKEMRFYENAGKLVFMGKTIDFEDIVSCNIVDDPQFIPGRTTTYGAGLSFFGFGFGGADSYTTPGKTIHNYVVDIQIDNLKTPIIRIATGQNELKAREISSVFEYILRHQNKYMNANTRKTVRRTTR